MTLPPVTREAKTVPPAKNYFLGVGQPLSVRWWQDARMNNGGINMTKNGSRWNLRAALDALAAWLTGYHYIPGAWFEPVPVRRVRRNRYRA
jgi:hypothetical protein